MNATCISCDQSLYPNATFCHNCGLQQKCKSCQTPIVKNAKHCIECGVSLLKENDSSSNPINTIKFNQTADSRSYEIAFTDNVGAGVVEVIRNMTDNQPQLKLYNPKNDNDTNFHQIGEVIQEENEEERSQEEEVIATNSEIPHIIDIENAYEFSETHWILVYAFYISNYGKNSFNKESLIKAYKEKRETPSRLSNFSNKWKSLFKGLVRTIKTDEFRLTDKGIETVLGLIKGKFKSEASKALPSKKNKEKKTETEDSSVKKHKKTPAKSIQIEEFDLAKGDKKPALSDFLKEGQIGENTSYRILAIAYYITNYCKTDSFSEGNIEYAYKAIGLNNRPIHLYQVIVNAKNRNVWYEKNNSTGKWKLARAGELFFEDKLSKK